MKDALTHPTSSQLNAVQGLMLIILLNAWQKKLVKLLAIKQGTTGLITAVHRVAFFQGIILAIS